MEKFDFITNYSKSKKTAKMSIRRPIATNVVDGINGDIFAKEMEYLAEIGIDNVIIDINSVGGSIKEGFSIFSAIKDAPFHTTTRVVGIAASMAGIISQAGDKRIILDYGIFHAHGPQVPKGAKVDAELLNIMLGSLKTMISTKSGLPEEEISAMLGTETVLTALEAKEKGFFDEIEVSKGVKPVINMSNNVEALFEAVNTFINKSNKMEKISTFLALENSSEETVLSAVTELKAKADKVEGLESDITAKQTEIEALTAKVAEVETLTATILELKTKAATMLVENAIKAGKISEASKESWIEQASNDFEKTNDLIGSISSVVAAKKITFETPINETRKDWDFKTWGEKDAKGLEKLKNENPEQFNKLLNNYLNA
jgi:ATP-dependent Clp protease protease subunit